MRIGSFAENCLEGAQTSNKIIKKKFWSLIMFLKEYLRCLNFSPHPCQVFCPPSKPHLLTCRNISFSKSDSPSWSQFVESPWFSVYTVLMLLCNMSESWVGRHSSGERWRSVEERRGNKPHHHPSTGSFSCLLGLSFYVFPNTLNIFPFLTVFFLL